MLENIWFIWSDAAVIRDPMWLLTPLMSGTASRSSFNWRISASGAIAVNNAPGPGLTPGYSRGSMGRWSIKSSPFSLAIRTISRCCGLRGRMDRVMAAFRPMNFSAICAVIADIIDDDGDPGQFAGRQLRARPGMHRRLRRMDWRLCLGLGRRIDLERRPDRDRRIKRRPGPGRRQYRRFHRLRNGRHQRRRFLPRLLFQCLVQHQGQRQHQDNQGNEPCHAPFQVKRHCRLSGAGGLFCRRRALFPGAAGFCHYFC